jgi:putative acetyltransferase
MNILYLPKRPAEKTTMISIRPEKPGDAAAIRDLHKAAFDGTGEADIVDKFRPACPDLVSLVAVENDHIAGHILFSPVVVETNEGTVTGMRLAPMAVLPGYQRKGIGTELVRQGLFRLRDQGCPFVVVLGHARYSPRFGFEPALDKGLRSQWEGVPAGTWMVLILDHDRIKGVFGVARYREEFNEGI